MATTRPDGFVEEIELAGHIIDSLLLPKVLDLITGCGGRYEIKRITIGHHRHEPSYALLQVQAPSAQLLADILNQVADHGGVPTTQADCRLVEADMDSAFPEGFYSTTNQRTEIRLQGRWIEVQDQEMDCGVVVESGQQSARCVAMIDIRRGDRVVVGHSGVRVFPPERQEERRSFEFMTSAVSTEKPKGVAIREIAAEILRTHADGGRVLLVGGPAIIHSGSGEHVAAMVREGFVDVLFAGNALATHDIEQAFYGTSLGVRLDRGVSVDTGHEHHLRTINRIRRAGGIRQAVESGLLTSGVMYECVKRGVDYVLCGSIRDDGPLPDVITDVLESQRRMRASLKGVTFCLMVATTLHSIAVGNLLPASVRVVCVDINPSTVIKLTDRGSYQTVGLVTDVEPFLRALVQELHAKK